MKAKRPVALLVSLLLMLAVCPAQAQSLTVTADRLNLRAAPDLSAETMDVVKLGEELEFISESGDWYLVRADGREGYVVKEYVVFDEEKAAEDLEDTVKSLSAQGKTTARVNLRALPMTGAQILKVVPEKAEIDVTGRCGAWYRAEYAGKTGYLSAQYVTLEGESGLESAGKPEDDAQKNDPESAGSAPESGETLYEQAMLGEAAVRVNMRKGPSTAEGVVCVIAEGAPVRVTGEQGEWYRVRENGADGYIFMEYVKLTGEPAPGEEPEQTESAEQTEEPEAEPEAAQSSSGRTTGNVNLRRAATTESEVLCVLKKGTQVQLLGRSGEFCLALHEGKAGYISAKYLSADGGGNAAETIYPAVKTGAATVMVNMRSVPEGDILHTLKTGTQVCLLGECSGWYMVMYGGEIGYISGAYVEEREEAPAQEETEEDASGEEAEQQTGTAYVTAGSLNIRKGPGTGYGILGVLTCGAEVEYLSLSDGWYRIETENGEGYVSAEYISSDKPEEAVRGQVILSDWFHGEVADVFDRGDTATVTDVKTGLSFQVRRTGGYNHADAQPLTERDTEIMHKIYGYVWQWTRRAVWVTTDGRTYAASMNGMPHGETDDMPDNGFDGCFCIHFLNSRTHGTDRVDSAHQNCIQAAYQAGT